MAGIGFELKKLYKGKGIIKNIRAYIYSIFVTIGPIIISVLAITFLFSLLKAFGITRDRLELLQGTIMYSFIFSVILTSGYCMMLSRFLADRLYMQKEEDILPSFYGSLAFIVVCIGATGAVFYSFSPLDITYKFFAYFLYVGLSVQMVISVYISAVKNFRKVTWAFVFGVIAGIAAGYLLEVYTEIVDILSVLIAFDVFITIVIVFLGLEVKAYFRKRSIRYFDFLRYFEIACLPLLVNTFYTAGLYVHNIMFWMYSDMGRVLGETYIYAPYYDIPAGYAFLSIMPTLVIFVVKVETSFYAKYASYFQLINNNACFEDIEVSRKEMFTVIFRELIYIMEVQLFFSIGCMIIGMKYLPNIGFTSSQIDIYSIVILAYYCVIMSFVIMTILLYFDYQIGAVIISSCLFITNGLFTFLSIKFGSAFYGTGFLMSGFVTVTVAVMLLYRFLEQIDYYIFCVHVSWKAKEKGKISKLLDRIYEGE